MYLVSGKLEWPYLTSCPKTRRHLKGQKGEGLFDAMDLRSTSILIELLKVHDTICDFWQANFTTKLTRSTLITKLFDEQQQERSFYSLRSFPGTLLQVFYIN